MARKFDRRERDRECLRIALRLKDSDRYFVEGLAKKHNVSPAEAVRTLISVAFNREVLKELEQP